MESDGVNADMDAFEDDDEMLPDDPVLLDELEALLDWVWDSYGPCGCILNHDEREEIPDRFNAWRDSFGRNADGSLRRIVSFRAFGRWFLDLHQHFVYIRRHEAATDIIMLEQHEEEDGDVIEKHVEFKENHEERHTSLMLERVVNCLLNDSGKSIDEVHVYRGVSETKEPYPNDGEKEEQYVKVTVQSIENRLRKHRSRVRATSIHSKDWTPVTISPVEGTPMSDGSQTPHLDGSDKELKEQLVTMEQVPDRVDWGEMCETCADFDDDHIEDSIMGEPEDETEARKRYAMHLPMDDDDRHAEECMSEDVGDGSSDDSDDFKGRVYEDKYAEDCIADGSDDDDDDAPWVTPTKKKGDPRVGIAPMVTLPVVSQDLDVSLIRSQQQQQHQQQQPTQVMPVPVQYPHVSNESMHTTTAVVVAAPSRPPPPTVRMPRRHIEPHPVASKTMDVAPVVVLPPPPPPPPSSTPPPPPLSSTPPPPPSSTPPPPPPSLSAQIKSLPLPLSVSAIHEVPPQVRIPLRRSTTTVPVSTVEVVAMPPSVSMPMMEDHMTVSSMEVTIGSQQIGTIRSDPLVSMPMTITATATATTDSPLTVRMPNVDEEDRGTLVDVSELYNLWGDTEYDAPLEDRQRPSSFEEDYFARSNSGVFEYDDDYDEKIKKPKNK